MPLFVRDCYIAHWLFVSFLDTSRVSGNKNPWLTLGFLIIIKMLSNSSSIFCCSWKFLHIDLLSGDNNLNKIYVSPFLSFYWWDLIGGFIVGTVFSFKVFFPTLNTLFVTIFHCQIESSTDMRQLSQCHQESPSLNRFRRVYWNVKFKFSPSIAYRIFQNNISFAI